QPRVPHVVHGPGAIVRHAADVERTAELRQERHHQAERRVDYRVAWPDRPVPRAVAVVVARAAVVDDVVAGRQPVHHVAGPVVVRARRIPAIAVVVAMLVATVIAAVV